MTDLRRRTFLGAGATLGAAGAAGALVGGQPVAAAGTAHRPPFGSGVQWQPGHALPSFREPRHLDTADIRKQDGDVQTLLTTLQGIVNRREPRIYYLLQDDDTDAAWLTTMRIPARPYSDPWTLLAKYRHEITGVVVYDPDVPDSVNVATTIAGLRDAVVVSPGLLGRVMAAPYRLRIVEDLRGRFTNRVQAYTWALRNLWPQTSHHLLTGIGGTMTQPVPGVTWTTVAKVDHPVTDSSNKQTYDLDLSAGLGKTDVYVRFTDAYPSDGWGPAVEHVTVIADGATIADFQPTTAGETPYVYDLDDSQAASGGWRFADGSASFTYRFSPPAGTTSLHMKVLMWNEYVVSVADAKPTSQVASPIFRDYITATRAFTFWLDPLVAEEAALFTTILSKVGPNTPYLGWFTGGHEAEGVTLCSRHGVPVLAADYYTNGTVLSGARAPISSRIPCTPRERLANKLYVTLTMSEGDNAQYCEHRLRQIWDDPGRGQTPINWSISPLLADIGPVLLDYYQRTRSSNDLLLAGPSGAGYTYPGDWPDREIDQFTRRTGAYLCRTGMDLIYALNRVDETNVDLPAKTARSYRRHTDITGMLYNWIDESVVTHVDGLTVVTQLSASSVAQGQAVLADAESKRNPNAPTFLALGILAWNMTPSDVNQLAAAAGKDVSIVRADTFFDLLKRAR